MLALRVGVMLLLIRSIQLIRTFLSEPGSMPVLSLGTHNAILPPTDHECCTLKHNSPKLWKKSGRTAELLFILRRVPQRVVTDYFDDARQNRNHNNPDDHSLRLS